MSQGAKSFKEWANEGRSSEPDIAERLQAETAASNARYDTWLRGENARRDAETAQQYAEARRYAAGISAGVPARAAQSDYGLGPDGVLQASDAVFAAGNDSTARRLALNKLAEVTSKSEKAALEAKDYGTLLMTHAVSPFHPELDPGKNPDIMQWQSKEVVSPDTGRVNIDYFDTQGRKRYTIPTGGTAEHAGFGGVSKAEQTRQNNVSRLIMQGLGARPDASGENTGLQDKHGLLLDASALAQQYLHYNRNNDTGDNPVLDAEAAAYGLNQAKYRRGMQYKAMADEAAKRGDMKEVERLKEYVREMFVSELRRGETVLPSGEVMETVEGPGGSRRLTAPRAKDNLLRSAWGQNAKAIVDEAAKRQGVELKTLPEYKAALEQIAADLPESSLARFIKAQGGRLSDEAAKVLFKGVPEATRSVQFSNDGNGLSMTSGPAPALQSLRPRGTPEARATAWDERRLAALQQEEAIRQGLEAEARSRREQEMFGRGAPAPTLRNGTPVIGVRG